LNDMASMIEKSVESSDTVLQHEISNRLASLASQFRYRGLILHLMDIHNTEPKTAAAAICSLLDVPLLYIDMDRMPGAKIGPDELLALIFREGLLQKASLYVHGFDSLLTDEKSNQSAYQSLLAECNDYPFWVFLTGEKEWYPGDLPGRLPCIQIELPSPSYLERKQLWEKYCGSYYSVAADVNLTDIAGKFRLSNRQIQDAMATASNLALWRDPEKGEVTNEDLYSACRKMSGKLLGTLAHRIQLKYGWEDIVLPDDQSEQLHEMCSYVDNHHTVYENWGFGRKLTSGQGLNALFAGPSGTGKTMAAGIIAHELKLDLYKIDLSAIVSKYIGETEKNLERIFQEGRASNAILFFDEADALFGKRSEVKDAHDRYANIEIAYLLQKMDEYEGMVILATNLRKNMDDAFARRMHYSVEFPSPGEAERLRIWKLIFPLQAPLSPDVDLDFMSLFKITGGNIKNIAVHAAFLAVRDNSVIKMEHLIRATRREFQKTGRLCTEEDFAQYFNLVKL
jgi:SpoVK/Ycf46/Vps4 family AAA+-type ATPase